MLGVAPGLAYLAYSVLSLRGDPPVATLVDCDVVHSTGHVETAPIWALSRSARVHHMIMGVVFDRDPPATVCLGPAVDPEEPERSIEQVRTVLSSLAMGLRARVVSFETEDEVRGVLGESVGMEVGERGMRKAVRCSLTAPMPTRNRRVLLATAIGLAGAHRVRRELRPAGR